MLNDALAEYLKTYKLNHEGKWECVDYRIRSLNAFFGARTVGQITVKDVSDYQAARREQCVATATLNMEVGILCRGMGERGDLLRLELKRKKLLHLKGKPTVVGRAGGAEEQDRLLQLAQGL